MNFNTLFDTNTQQISGDDMPVDSSLLAPMSPDNRCKEIVANHFQGSFETWNNSNQNRILNISDLEKILNNSDLEKILRFQREFTLCNMMWQTLHGSKLIHYLPLPLNFHNREKDQNDPNMTKHCESEIISDHGLPVPVTLPVQSTCHNMAKWEDWATRQLNYATAKIAMDYFRNFKTYQSAIRTTATDNLRAFEITSDQEINDILNRFFPLSNDCLDNRNTDTTAVWKANARAVENNSLFKNPKAIHTIKKVLNFIGNDPLPGDDFSGQEIHQMPTNDVVTTDSVLESYKQPEIAADSSSNSQIESNEMEF